MYANFWSVLNFFPRYHRIILSPWWHNCSKNLAQLKRTLLFYLLTSNPLHWPFFPSFCSLTLFSFCSSLHDLCLRRPTFLYLTDLLNSIFLFLLFLASSLLWFFEFFLLERKDMEFVREDLRQMKKRPVLLDRLNRTGLNIVKENAYQIVSDYVHVLHRTLNRIKNSRSNLKLTINMLPNSNSIVYITICYINTFCNIVYLERTFEWSRTGMVSHMTFHEKVL